MAKVQGPLFSLKATGSYAGALVFANWKGRDYVRQLVIPANPHSAGQETARNAFRVAGVAQHQTDYTAEILNGETLTDKALLTAAVPAGFAWNGWLVDNVIGKGALSYTADAAAYALLAAGEKTAWDDAAAARDIPVTALYQSDPGGAAGTPLAAGEVYWHIISGINRALGRPSPTAVPPTYA
jgi:hypothetical protein